MDGKRNRGVPTTLVQTICGAIATLVLLIMTATTSLAAPPAASSSGVFVAIVSRDAASFARLAGACYIINGASIEGCDENGDGQVDFRGVQPGSYTVTQTLAPAGYQPVPDFLIGITTGGEYTVNHDRLLETWRATPAFVAIASLDATTGIRLAGGCYIINGGSIEGCDENGDGQVDFRGVQPGTYTVTQTLAPAGYRAAVDFEIIVPSGGAQTVRVQLLRQ